MAINILIDQYPNNPHFQTSFFFYPIDLTPPPPLEVFMFLSGLPGTNVSWVTQCGQSYTYEGILLKDVSQITYCCKSGENWDLSSESLLRKTFLWIRILHGLPVFILITSLEGQASNPATFGIKASPYEFFEDTEFSL